MFQPNLNSIVIAFIDDLLASLKRGGSCAIFEDCGSEIKGGELYVKFIKYELWISSMVFLGHVTSKNGSMVNLVKVEPF